MKLKILSWNIWNECRFDLLKEFLKSHDADVIGLQEVLLDDPERDVIGFLTELGYRHVFAMTEHSWDGKTYKIGPALFTKLPVINSETFLIDKDDERAVAHMDIKVNGKAVHFFSAHLVHTHQRQSAQQEAEVIRLMEKLPDKNVIVMGDFNATSESYAVRKISEKLINSDPSDQPTWSVYPEGCHVCKPDKIDIRLDYIFASQDIKISSPKVESSKASDHLPISAIAEI